MRPTRLWMLAVSTLVAGAGLMAIASPEPPATGKFVVHEWGTFSSFSGSDGTALKFNPANTDLPKFVHKRMTFTKNEQYATVSLETPVVYFYADRPLTADVRAEFPTGVFTEWFPRTANPLPGRELVWKGIRVQPGDHSPLPLTPGENHYYAARETDAAPVEMVVKHENKEIVEREKFLFYRGVGDPKLPLTMTAQGNGTFTLKATGDTPIPAAVVVEINAGRARFRPVGPISPGAATKVTLSGDWSGIDAVRATLVEQLTAAGLYEKEARAMVKTWESAWLKDEGARVLYLLSGAWVDGTLPLKVSPKPDTLLRVMVGRHDVLTPERERDLDRVISQKPANKEATTAALAKLGRFAGPAREQAERRIKSR